MLTKTIYFFLISFIIFISSSFTPKFKPTFGIKTVVIDAGHGGKDPGCHGSLYKEKDIALAVALRLGKYIEDNLKDVKVVYTRKTDIFVELQERAEIANRAKADLFICIHCNSACVRDKVKKKDICRDQVHGAETYVMGIKNEKGKLDVAKRENASILLEDNYVQKYQGFDPNSDESYIIMSMFNDTYLNQSLSFASKAQKQYSTKAGRDDHGVKRASLWVLWRTYMPSVLTEIGYLTNKREELFLGSDKGQDYISSSLFRAFREYKDDIEGTSKKYNDDIENQEPYHLTKEDSLDMIASEKLPSNDDTLVTETLQVKEKKADTVLDDVVLKKDDTGSKGISEKKEDVKTAPPVEKPKDVKKEVKKESKKEEKKPTAKDKKKDNKVTPVTDKNKDDKKDVVDDKYRKVDRTQPFVDTPVEETLPVASNDKKEDKKPVPSETKKEVKQQPLIEKPKEEKKIAAVEFKKAEKPQPIIEKPKEEKKVAAVEVKKEEKPQPIIEKPKEEKPQPAVELPKEEKKEIVKENTDDSKPFPMIEKPKEEKPQPVVKETKEVKKSVEAEAKKTEKPKPAAEKPKEEKKVIVADKTKVEEVKKAIEPETKQPTTSEPASSSTIVYKVQFLCSDKKLALKSDKIKGVTKPGMYEDNGVFKYTSGEFTSKKEAVDLQNEMRKNGFKDAFVISMQDNKRIPMK